MTPPLQTPPTCQTLERINKDFSPEADFEARQVTKKDFPGRYMYRDFGTQYWEATHTWVQEYLNVSVWFGAFVHGPLFSFKSTFVD